MVSLLSVRKTFDEQINSSVGLYFAVETDAKGHWHNITGWDGLAPGHSRRIVGLAFMQMVIAWDEFVEAVLVRYVGGASAPNGYKPESRIAAARSLQHAYQLLSGNPKFRLGMHHLQLNSWRDVKETASVFLVKGKPFSAVTEMQMDRLVDSKKIRNRVAHFSPKARQGFITVAKAHLGLAHRDTLPRGYDVGRLLLDKSSKGFSKVDHETYFIHYANLFLCLAEVICPIGEPNMRVERTGVAAVHAERKTE